MNIANKYHIHKTKVMEIRIPGSVRGNRTCSNRISKEVSIFEREGKGYFSIYRCLRLQYLKSTFS